MNQLRFITPASPHSLHHALLASQGKWTDLFDQTADTFAGMETPAIDITDNPSSELLKEIRAGLVAFNVEKAGLSYAQPLAITMRQDGELVAGIHGEMLGKWLHIERFWISEALRKQGLGTQLLRTVEDEARRRGCIGAYLDTFSFQAKPFYERNGYRQFGELTDFVGESSESADQVSSFPLHFLSKRL